jgi:hypothetical protein
VYVQRAVRLSAAGSFRPVPAGRSRFGARRRPRYGRCAAAAARFAVRRTDLAHSLRRRRRARLRTPRRGRRSGGTASRCAFSPSPVRSQRRSFQDRRLRVCVSTVNLRIMLRPEIGRDYPLNLSILLSGGKETNKDSLSNGE